MSWRLSAIADAYTHKTYYVNYIRGKIVENSDVHMIGDSS